MRDCIRISVVMPIYNCAQYLDDSIGSVLQQDYDNYELLLIDDGSTDNSWEICKSYMEKDSRIRAIHIENRGVSGARNLGMKEASGEYIYFVDADDTLFPNALSALEGPLTKDPTVDIVIAYYDGTDRDVNKGDMPKGVYATTEVLQHLLMNAPTFYYGVCWNKMYRLSLLRKYDLRFEVGMEWSEDMLFNMAYLKCCKKIAYIDEVVYFYNRVSKNAGGAKKKIYTLEHAHNGLCQEKKRIAALDELIIQHGKKDELSGWLYDFAINRFNLCFSNAFRVENITERERRHLLCDLVEKSEIRDFLSGYVHQKRYWAENVYVWIIRGKHNRLLYYFTRLKYCLQGNKRWQLFLKKHKSIWPKYSL